MTQTHYTLVSMTNMLIQLRLSHATIWVLLQIDVLSSKNNRPEITPLLKHPGFAIMIYSKCYVFYRRIAYKDVQFHS